VGVVPWKDPHPLDDPLALPAAWTVKVAAFVPAVPDGATGPNISQDGSEPGVITPLATVPGTTVKGVPRLAADVTETVLGAPGT
jgi:hypothetical protein